ncbi:MAG: hypothetical protein K0S44_3197 [Bacteroidetes bacterium]|jgi:DNA helicase HerA-like ATPase|nr:hypothetical protein [Bacteroidota bacterium]
MSAEKFKTLIDGAFNFSGKSILLGGAVHDMKSLKDTFVKIPLAMFNRHGLIAGATGTGKTKSIQRIAEALSENGVNVLLMDIKGDISGISRPGTEEPRIRERMDQIGLTWIPTQYPTELMSISDEKGVRLRSTVSEFGPVLFSKILELNDNQQGAVAIIFKYCDDKKLPLLDIKDFRAALQHLSDGEGKKEIRKNYGSISSATSGVIMRKLLEIEQQGGNKFFGEQSFDVEDLLQKHDDKAFINIIRLTDIQDKPKLFSTFMLCLLAEIYNKFPETGDKGLPKLVIFIDEAHLIFKEASSELMQQMETIIKLIRSKGVGIFFCTQAPTDIPEVILSQLGNKIQHALRAFTAKDRKSIKLISENFPESDFYKTDQLLTELGIGEALVTVLNEKGIPTQLVHTMMGAPQSRIDVLTPQEQEEQVNSSKLVKKYSEVLDRESAYEMLQKKITIQEDEQVSQSEKKEKARIKDETNFSDTLKSVANSNIAKTVVREVARGLFGVLLGKTSTKRRSGGLF